MRQSSKSKNLNLTEYLDSNTMSQQKSRQRNKLNGTIGMQSENQDCETIGQMICFHQEINCKGKKVVK